MFTIRPCERLRRQYIPTNGMAVRLRPAFFRCCFSLHLVSAAAIHLPSRRLKLTAQTADHMSTAAYPRCRIASHALTAHPSSSPPIAHASAFTSWPHSTAGSLRLPQEIPSQPLCILPDPALALELGQQHSLSTTLLSDTVTLAHTAANPDSTLLTALQKIPRFWSRGHASSGAMMAAPTLRSF